MTPSNPEQTQPWSLYWPDWLVKLAVGEGTPRAVYGGWNQNTRPLAHVRPGDTVFLLSGYQGRLHLLGGIAVERAGPAWQPEGIPHPGASVQVAGEPLAPFRIDRIVPPDWLDAWRFQNADGRERTVAHLADGVLAKTSSFQGCYRLSPQTGASLAGLLAGESLLSTDPLLRQIEQQRCAHATDRELAQVHADALLERGDPRGLVIRLELEDAHHGNRRARAALRSHLEHHEAAILARPGGFPFRKGWGWPKRCR